MTRVAETGRAGDWWPEGEGRLPFVLRVGVTGHRDLADQTSLRPAIRAALQGLAERFLGSEAEPRLLVISALAEGADRLVAREVLAGPDAELEAVLPLPDQEYLADFVADESKTEFAELLDRAVTVWRAPPGSSREEAYERAGRHVVDRSDVIIALWDGQPSRGRGGTATVVSYARDQGVPLAWVNTSAVGPADPVYFYDHDRAARVEEAAREFREYNTAEISQFAARERDEWQRVAPTADGGEQAGAFGQACQSAGQWIIPYFVRADVLASRWERIFNLTSWVMFLAAAAAVVIVTVQVAFASHENWIAGVEVLLLMLLVVTPLLSRRRRVLDRWISYRFLAERLRSGYFLALAGAGDRPTGDRHERPAYLTDPTEVWLRRALEEVTALRPQVKIGPDDIATLRDYLCDRWIGAQVRYHEKSARQQGGWDGRLFGATGVLFAVTAVAAFLHLLGLGEHNGHASEFGRVLIVLSICVPAVGAALHGIRTQAEFRRHAQRYQRMAGLLRRLETDMSRAQSIEWIHEIALDAERLMRAENSDWFGVMRFHDVELIT